MTLPKPRLSVALGMSAVILDKLRAAGDPTVVACATCGGGYAFCECCLECPACGLDCCGCCELA